MDFRVTLHARRAGAGLTCVSCVTGRLAPVTPAAALAAPAGSWHTGGEPMAERLTVDEQRARWHFVTRSLPALPHPAPVLPESAFGWEVAGNADAEGGGPEQQVG